MNTNKIYITLLLGAIALLTSCDKFLDIRPTGRVIAQTGEEYRALLTYEYNNFPDDRGLATFRSDEMTLDPAYTSTEDNSSFFDIWAWNDSAAQATTASFGWRRYYHTIYIANTIIEQQNNITEISANERNQLVGEAYMMRAYCHFLLANLFAQPYTKVNADTTRAIPLALTADVNAVLTRSTLAQVYNQVESDIAQADSLMNVETWDAGFNYRFNKISAQALKARLELYKGNWSGALQAAQNVIAAHPALQDMTGSNPMLPNNYRSVESIVSLERVMTATYNRAGKVSNQLLALYKAGDQRSTYFYNQINSSITAIRKGGGGDFRSTFRSAEFYLIAAEADAQLGNLDEAKNYLKQLMRTRYRTTRYDRNAAEVDALNQADLINYIYDERARELAFEGHRWFDLRRTTQPQIVKTYNNNSYTLQQNDRRYTLRIPTEAIEANPALAN